MPSAPTTERGQVSPFQGTSILGGYSGIVQDLEKAPELRWPTRLDTYKAMLNDSQIEGLIRGTVLPIQRFRWQIDPNGAKPNIVEHVAQDLNLPVVGVEETTRRRRAGRFSFARHLKEALASLSYGSAYFEQVGEIQADGLWHLRKLAPRPLRTFSEPPVVERDGGLKEIRQYGDRSGGLLGGFLGTPISVDRLVAYVWDSEPGDWLGRSMLRSCFRNWVTKDMLIRIDAMKHERTGVGTPIYEGAEGDSPKQREEGLATATALRSGEEAGAAIPNGASLTIEGVRGSVPDTVASLRWHDEQMARAFLMMFMQLGSTETGSRALGSEFLDFFRYSQDSIADAHADVFNEHVIEDLVEWNYGPDEPAPVLVYDRSTEEELPTADLALLVEKGIITVDPELEATIRAQRKLPPKPENAPVTPAEPVTAHRKPASAAATAPSNPRREMYDHEVFAAVDFEAMEQTYTSERDRLVADVQEAQAEQITELREQIEDAADLASLTVIAAAPVAGALITASMQRMSSKGVGQVTAEANAQGKVIDTPNLGELHASVETRAMAIDTTLARSISEAASRKALSLAGGSLTMAQVAEQTAQHLGSLSPAYLEEQLGGAVQQGMNAGRKAVMRDNVPTSIYASALLDENCCQSCKAEDGTEYDTLAEAEQTFPTGGNAYCLGGLRCRCTVVAEWS